MEEISQVDAKRDANEIESKTDRHQNQIRQVNIRPTDAAAASADTAAGRAIPSASVASSGRSTSQKQQHEQQQQPQQRQHLCQFRRQFFLNLCSLSLYFI